jgi:hypothetical protein
MIAVALATFYAALFLFAPTTIDAIPDATKNVLIIAMMVGAVLSLILGRRRKIRRLIPFIGVGTSHPLAPRPF